MYGDDAPQRTTNASRDADPRYPRARALVVSVCRARQSRGPIATAREGHSRRLAAHCIHRERISRETIDFCGSVLVTTGGEASSVRSPIDGARVGWRPGRDSSARVSA